MEKENQINTILLSSLKEYGYNSRVVKIYHMHELKDSIDKNYSKGLFNEEFYQERLTGFVFKPSINLSQARSIIIVAAFQPQFRIKINLNEESYSYIIPPTYLYYSDKQINKILTEILKPYGYYIERAILPVKLLAVHSGLCQYGKNNISYIPGMGSFFRLTAYYTDMPCLEDIWDEIKVMEECTHCEYCLRSCPTGALSSERFLLYAERCISFHNERSIKFPQWIKHSWHNCLIGCLYCQRACPLNKKLLRQFEDKVEFSQVETLLLLKGVKLEKHSEETIIKLKEIDWLDDLDILARNLNVLINRDHK